MKKNFRIIPRLDVKGSKLVKGIKFEGLRVIGDPYLYCLEYYKQFADEILFIDPVASLYNRNNLTDIVNQTTKNIFIPITVGGGIKNIEDAKKIFEFGADRVSINTGLVQNPKLLDSLVKVYGSQAILAYLEVTYYQNKFFLLTDNAREKSDLDVKEWIDYLCKNGAGELLISFVDTEGTANGIDTDLVNRLSENITRPFLVHGGVGNISHIKNISEKTNADGVCISSLIHYAELFNNQQDQSSNTISSKYNTVGNTDFISNDNRNNEIKNNYDLQRLKDIKLKFNSKIYSCRRYETSQKINKIKFKNNKISILHCENANLTSLINFFKRNFNFDVNLTKKIDKNCDLMILPGNGNFCHNMNHIKKNNNFTELINRFKNNLPTIGICAGMQIFYESSIENKYEEGLKLLKGNFVKFKEQLNYKVPNIGWREVYPSDENCKFDFKDKSFYYMHSYYPENFDKNKVIAFSEYSNIKVPAIVKDKNFVGFQFHPEKSSYDGYLVFEHFVKQIL